MAFIRTSNKKKVVHNQRLKIIHNDKTEKKLWRNVNSISIGGLSLQGRDAEAAAARICTVRRIINKAENNPKDFKFMKITVEAQTICESVPRRNYSEHNSYTHKCSQKKANNED